MKVKQQNWLLAPIAFCGIVLFTFFDDDRALHCVGTVALILSMAWVLMRDYTNIGLKQMSWWLVGLYGAFALIFLLFLPATPDYLWWRVFGTMVALGLGLYIALQNLRKPI